MLRVGGLSAFGGLKSGGCDCCGINSKEFSKYLTKGAIPKIEKVQEYQSGIEVKYFV